jgi:hypothetical protein
VTVPEAEIDAVMERAANRGRLRGLFTDDDT